MPSFDPSGDLSQLLDYRLLLDGPATLYLRRSVLDTDCDWLERRGYAVVRLQAGEWLRADDAHNGLAGALGFPDYYGANLNALNDCLSDVAAGDHGLGPEGVGLVLVLLGFDSFAGRGPDAAQAIVDVFATQSRAGLLVGHRMLCLIQTDDARFALAPVGASDVPWNSAEWLLSARGL